MNKLFYNTPNLGAVLIGIFICLSGTTAKAEADTTSPRFEDGGKYFVDGLMTWQKTQENVKSYTKAVEYCNEQPADAMGAKWHIPTPQQLTIFWHKAINTKSQKQLLDQYKWVIDDTWVKMSEPNSDRHAYFKLKQNDTRLAWSSGTNHVLCVKYPTVDDVWNYYDGKFTWSQVKEEDKKLPYDKAEEYCKNLGRTAAGSGSHDWSLPTKEQLLYLLSNSGEQRILDDQGWAFLSQNMWSSTPGTVPESHDVLGLNPYIASPNISSYSAGASAKVICVNSKLRVKMGKIKPSPGGRCQVSQGPITPHDNFWNNAPKWICPKGKLILHYTRNREVLHNYIRLDVRNGNGLIKLNYRINESGGAPQIWFVRPDKYQEEKAKHDSVEFVLAAHKILKPYRYDSSVRELTLDASPGVIYFPLIYTDNVDQGGYLRTITITNNSDSDICLTGRSSCGP